MENHRSACSSRTCSGSGSGSGDDGGLRDVRLMALKVRCELCSQAASLYCAADEAQLCLDCDERIHSANFLVARHSRSLICSCCGALMVSQPTSRFHVCQACAAEAATAAAAAAYQQLHCDEESKVEYSSDDDEEEQAWFLVMGGTIGTAQEARKRPHEDASWMEEGVGDSEEENYSATFKRRLLQPSPNKKF